MLVFLVSCDRLGDDVAKSFVKGFYQPVCLWIVDGEHSPLDFVLGHEAAYILVFEVHTIVQMYSSRYPKSMENVLSKEVHY